MEEQNFSNSYLISFIAGGLLYDETISLQPYLNDEKIELINYRKIQNYSIVPSMDSSTGELLKKMGYILHSLTMVIHK